jgi:uncharacterized protein
MIRSEDAREFLTHHRIAVVGVSVTANSIATIVWHEMLKRGYDAIPVNPHHHFIDGVRCYRNLDAIPGEVDGVIVMVHRDRADAVVSEAIARGIKRVWLFKGLGGAGAVSDEAVARCRAKDVTVIAGACPMMFLEPMSPVHKVHRALRRMNRSLVGTPR